MVHPYSPMAKVKISKDIARLKYFILFVFLLSQNYSVFAGNTSVPYSTIGATFSIGKDFELHLTPKISFGITKKEYSFLNLTLSYSFCKSDPNHFNLYSEYGALNPAFGNSITGIGAGVSFYNINNTPKIGYRTNFLLGGYVYADYAFYFTNDIHSTFGVEGVIPVFVGDRAGISVFNP